jgi:hypothetical protein
MGGDREIESELPRGARLVTAGGDDDTGCGRGGAAAHHENRSRGRADDTAGAAAYGAQHTERFRSP